MLNCWHTIHKVPIHSDQISFSEWYDNLQKIIVIPIYLCTSETHDYHFRTLLIKRISSYYDVCFKCTCLHQVGFTAAGIILPSRFQRFQQWVTLSSWGTHRVSILVFLTVCGYLNLLSARTLLISGVDLISLLSHSFHQKNVYVISATGKLDFAKSNLLNLLPIEKRSFHWIIIYRCKGDVPEGETHISYALLW